MDQIKEKCKAELFIPSEANWETIRERIVTLENDAFPEHPYSEEDLHREFTNPENIVVLLRDIEIKQIVGYVYSVMINSWYPERRVERNETAFLDNIVLDKAYRGHHLTEVMMSVWEKELKNEVLLILK